MSALLEPAPNDPRARLGPVAAVRALIARRPWQLVLGVLVLLSATRVITGADEITSAGTIGAALALAVPIGLAALGGLWSERAGVVNIGLEGMMILGTWLGAYVGYTQGIWWGVAAGALGGALGGLVHALATVTFGVDHIVSGVAINIVAAGLARYLSVVVYNGVPGAGATQSPRVDGSITTLSLPLLSGGFGGPEWLGTLADKRWFLLSDAAGIALGLTSNISLFTVVAGLLVVLSWFLLWRTAFGLRLRSCGEAPLAAESLGVAVYRMKYIGVVISGALAGLGGAFLVTVSSSFYREGQTTGRGFIGLAALIFGNWRPGGLAGGAGLFGYAQGLQLRQGSSVHALLLFLSFVLLIVGLRAALRGRVRPAALTLLASGALAFWYAVSDTVPSRLVSTTPYVVTLLVLAISAQRLRPPAADGQPYRKGQQS